MSFLPRYYIDTSVVGGYFDKEFRDATQNFFRQFGNGEIIFVVSDLLELELLPAPEHVRELFDQFPYGKIEHVELSIEAEILANTYVEQNVVGKTSLEDCRHIAIATLCKVDVLVSWNFKHIVNLDKIRGYNSINLRLGHPMIEIRSPRDLIYDNEI